MSEQITLIEGNSTLRSYQITQPMTVKEFLQKLQLQASFFAILVNGKRVQLTDKLEIGSEITILPKIAGG